jgi:hypothetical protein
MLIDDYKKRLASFETEQLVSIQARRPISFRSFFNLMAEYGNLERLNTQQLEEMREYIKIRVEQSPKDASGLNTTNEFFTDSDEDSFEAEIDNLSRVTSQQLHKLEKDCQSLRQKTPEENDLVTELRNFIADTRDAIEGARREPELSYPGVDKDRCDSLHHISTDIQAKQTLVKSILASQKNLSPSTSKYKSDMQHQTKAKNSSEEGVAVERRNQKRS